MLLEIGQCVLFIIEKVSLLSLGLSESKKKIID